MFKVLILYKSLPQYRVAFFDLLREELSKNNITLELIYGDADYKGRSDSATNDWATFKKNKYLKIGKSQLIWQPCLKEIKSADIVIVEQADRLLINYILISRRILRNKKFAFWGHGQNMLINRNSVANIFKTLYINHCDWWFAYTDGIKSFLVKNGYSRHKITTVQNSIDTKKMILDYNSITEIELEKTRNELGILQTDLVLIYCGALYKEKRLDMLIDSLDSLNRKGFNAKLLILGGGPDEQIIKNAILSRPYLLFIGPKFGREKAKFFKLSSIFLLPAAMGLAILDSFAFATPVVTTQNKFHGPEIEYLKNDVNGIITPNNLDSFTNAIIELLGNTNKLALLKENCLKEANNYSNEKMVRNFIEGIQKSIMV
jgi:glycosyltransferase involved in cell wall biosynthesis